VQSHWTFLEGQQLWEGRSPRPADPRSELPSATAEIACEVFQKLLASYELLIVDELGYVPLSKSGAELLFETFSQRYERASTLVTSNIASIP
jgi:DNA replication protein DnaC